MKTTKKSVQVPFLSTMKKSKEVPKLIISGLEIVASKLRNRAQQIASLEVEQKTEESLMLNIVKEKRIEAEKGGKFFKTCLVESEDGNSVKIQFSNKFSKIDASNEPVLRECLGGLFDEIYVNRTGIKLRDTVSPETLKEKIGEELYMALFEEEKWIAHTQDFMEHRAKLRMTLNEKTNQILDQLVDQTQAKSSVSYK